MSEAEASAVKPPLSGATASPKLKAKRTRKSSATPIEPTITPSSKDSDSKSVPDKTPTDADLIKYANKGLTVREISTLTNIPKSTVHNKLQELKDDVDFISFKENKASVLEQMQFKLLNSVDTDLLKVMLSKRGMTDVAILEDKIRLIRGEATSISTIDIRALGVLVNLTPQSNTDSSVIDVEE